MQGSAGGVPLKLPDFQGPAWMKKEQEQAEAPEAFGILPENWDAAMAFIKCATQWHRDAQGTLAGLRYPALELVIKHYPCTDPDDVFQRVQIIEGAAVERARRMAPKSTS